MQPAPPVHAYAGVHVRSEDDDGRREKWAGGMWVCAVRAAALVLSVRTAAGFRPDHESRDFAKMDTDGDGLLSAAEVEANIDSRLNAEIDGFMAFFDANGDGEVTKTEYGAQAPKFFVTDQRTEDWFWKSLFATNDSSEAG